MRLLLKSAAILTNGFTAMLHLKGFLFKNFSCKRTFAGQDIRCIWRAVASWWPMGICWR